MISDIDFNFFRAHQFCDNECCSYYGQVGVGNIKTKSRKKLQLYCKGCKQIFSARKGTMFFGLRTPMDKIVQVLSLLARGIGVNAVCRECAVTADSVRSWLLFASRHVRELSAYMEQGMHLEQVQIDEFWSFIRKKRAFNGG
jgi:hypothetical protein